ncbi:MAG: hypothetical protein WDZ51_10275 [Pirellulaceae bacterium]
MTTANPSDLQITQGVTSSIEAEVLLAGEPARVAELLGERFYLTGPFSDLARTLPVRHRFLPRPGEEVWRALVPDPILWAPRNPAYYCIQREADTTGALRAEHGIPITLRDLYARKQSFYLEGRRWVMRAGDARLLSSDSVPADDWREAGLTMITGGESPPSARALTRQGITWVADLRAINSTDEVVRWIDPYRTEAALTAVVVAEGIEFTAIKKASPHLLVGRFFDSADNPENASRADFRVVRRSDLPQAIQTAVAGPLVLADSLESPVLSPPDLRVACDQLQAAVSGSGNLAGIWIIGEDQ